MFRFNKINIGIYSGDNIYTIGSLNPITPNPASPTAIGIWTDNYNDTFILGSIYAAEDAYAYGVNFGQHSGQNIVPGGRAYGATYGQYVDQSVGATNKWLSQVVNYNA